MISLHSNIGHCNYLFSHILQYLENMRSSGPQLQEKVCPAWSHKLSEARLQDVEAQQPRGSVCQMCQAEARWLLVFIVVIFLSLFYCSCLYCFFMNAIKSVISMCRCQTDVCEPWRKMWKTSKCKCSLYSKTCNLSHNGVTSTFTALDLSVNKRHSDA